ncbi:MAG: DUF3775 domain-containing protein [Gammaproteobacteria bacterium]
MINLDLNSETVCRLIALAREFHAQEEVVIPEEPGNPGDDWARQVLASHGDDATFQEFKSIVLDLEPDQQYQLVVLMWLGRGDYSMDEWPEAIEYAAENSSPATAQYLIAHPMVAEYLTDGLQIFGLDCENES